MHIDKEVENAIVNVSGLGHFDLFVNGKKVGDHFLDAGWTHYAKTALYVTFEISDFLERENVLSVMLGNGFYNVPRVFQAADFFRCTEDEASSPYQLQGWNQ